MYIAKLYISYQLVLTGAVEIHKAAVVETLQEALCRGVPSQNQMYRIFFNEFDEFDEVNI